MLNKNLYITLIDQQKTYEKPPPSINPLKFSQPPT